LLILSAIDILIATETEIIRINEGELFELKCSTHLQFPVVWLFRQNDGTHEIFLGGKISKSFKGMFILTGNQSLGEYNLLIPSADDRYAGSYKCTDDEGLGPELMSIQLYIIASISTQPARDAAVISSQNNRQSNSITISAVVCGIVLPAVVIVIVIVITVALRKWYPKRDGRKDSRLIKIDVQPPSNPDPSLPSIEISTPSDTSNDACKISDSIASLPLAKKPEFMSQLSTESEESKSARRRSSRNSNSSQTGRLSQLSSRSRGPDSPKTPLLTGDEE